MFIILIVTSFNTKQNAGCMRSYSITIRPDSVKGKFHSFVVKGSLIAWALSLFLVTLVVLGLIFYYAVIVPYEVVSARAGEARELQSKNERLASSIEANHVRLEKFDKEVQAHLTVTEKFNFLFGIDDVGGGGYGVEATGEFDELLNTMDLVEERYQKLDGYMKLLDKLPIRFPIDGKFRFTSGFGPRRSPFSRKVEMHRGIDLAAKRGTAILAAGTGVVEAAGRWNDVGDPKYARLGRFIKIRHGETGYTTLYGHCSKVLVKTGEKVSAGQLIGRVGNTGWSTAPHLHFGIIQNNRYVDPKFYLLYFDAELIVSSVFNRDGTGGMEDSN